MLNPDHVQGGCQFMKCPCLFQDKTQMTMLITWLIEIYLNQLGELKEQQLESSPRFRTLQEEFQTFLKQTRTKVIILVLLASSVHG